MQQLASSPDRGFYLLVYVLLFPLPLTAGFSPNQAKCTDPDGVGNGVGAAVQHGYQIDGWTPKPTRAAGSPLVVGMQKRQSFADQVCGVMQGNSEYSDYTYTCQASETCLLDNNWWGCCWISTVPGCNTIICPTVSSCVEYAQRNQCDQACDADTGILKCTDTNSPFCATATAISNSASSPAPIDPDTTYDRGSPVFFACEPTQYRLGFTVDAVQSEELVCAPPWVANPTSLSSWSAANPSYPHTFDDLFGAIAARDGATITDSSVTGTVGGLGAEGPSAASSSILSFPTTTTSLVSSTSTSTSTSNAAEVRVGPTHKVIACMCGLVVILGLAF